MVKMGTHGGLTNFQLSTTITELILGWIWNNIFAYPLMPTGWAKIVSLVVETIVYSTHLIGNFRILTTVQWYACVCSSCCSASNSMKHFGFTWRCMRCTTIACFPFVTPLPPFTQIFLEVYIKVKYFFKMGVILCCLPWILLKFLCFWKKIRNGVSFQTNYIQLA